MDNAQETIIDQAKVQAEASRSTNPPTRPKRQGYRVKSQARYRNGKDQQSDDPQTEDVSDRVKHVFAKIVFAFVIGVRLIVLSFRPPYNCIWFALGTLYCLGVTLEGYYQTAPGREAIAFMFKPGINDNPNFLLNFPALWFDAAWYILGGLGFAIQAAEAWSLSEMSLSEKRVRFENANQIEAPEPRKNANFLAKHYASSIQQHGRKQFAKFGVIIWAFWSVDAIVQHNKYPWLTSIGALFSSGAPSDFGVNFLWFWVSVAGVEIFATPLLISFRQFRYLLPRHQGSPRINPR